MNKFKIDTSIIDCYLQEDLDSYSENDIYMISENQNIFQKPTLINFYRINNLYQNLIASLEEFNFTEEEKYQIFLNEENLEQQIVIKLVVGFPKEIRKIFLEDKNGKKNIIFDLHNYVEVINDNGDILKDIFDYLRYAVALLILDMKESCQIKTHLDRLAHALYVTSFAYYISSSKQLKLLDNSGSLDMWLFLEYDTLRKRTKKDINNYLDMVLTYNPEMTILGVSGKLSLDSLSEVEALKCFSDGPKKFLNTVLQNDYLKNNYYEMKSISIIKIILIPLFISLGVSIIPILITNKVNIFFKTMPLVIMILLSLKNFFQNKLNYISNHKLLINLSIYFILSLFFLLIFM